MKKLRVTVSLGDEVVFKGKPKRFDDQLVVIDAAPGLPLEIAVSFRVSRARQDASFDFLIARSGPAALMADALDPTAARGLAHAEPTWFGVASVPEPRGLALLAAAALALAARRRARPRSARCRSCARAPG
jgi:hypothetical protein